MKVLVTGGSGFIGRRLCAALEGRGDTVYAPSHEAFALPSDSAAEYIASIDPEVVFHVAGKTAGDPDVLERANADGTACLVHACRNSRVQAVVIAGSLAEYGNASTPFTEDTMTQPVSPYGLSKLRATEAALALSAEVPCTVLRLSNVYGPGGHSFIERAQEAIGKGETVRVTDVIRRDYIHVDDVVRACIAASERIARCRGMALNIGSGETHTTREVAYRIAEIAGREPESFIHASGYEVRATDQISNETSIARACDVLGWSPRMPLFDVLSQA